MADRQRFVRRSESQWRRIFQRYEASGLSIARFCEQEGIARATFSHWRRKLRDSTSDSVPTKGTASPGDTELASRSPAQRSPFEEVFAELTLPDGPDKTESRRSTATRITH